MSEADRKETRPFKAELKQLLHLITHALYSDREIFLRELISNASDAINKVRFDSLSDPDRLEGDKELRIRIIPDRAAGTLTVSDNGIGMSRDSVAEDLGTVARSGTRAFLEALRGAGAADRPGMIGQFGVGFYSAFMVADTVTVTSRAAGEPAASGVRWVSDGQGEFTVEPFEKAGRGTDVTLHLKEDAREFLDEYTLRALVKKFSDFIEHPILLASADPDKPDERVNTQKAVWLRNRKEVSGEEYAEFYRQVSGDSEPPARTVHYSVEGQQEFRVLMFVPSHKPMWFDWEEPKPGLKLYAQRVLIMDPCEELLPYYMRFVKGVLDSADLPLNISRELLQQTPMLAGMRKSVVKNVFEALEGLKKADPDTYARFFRDLGGMLKEGVARDRENRETLADLLLFETANSNPGVLIDLATYVGSMPEGQEAIHYLIGESRELLEHSPYLEAHRAKGEDVLLLTDVLIDEYAMPHLTEYKGKPFRRADRARGPEAAGGAIEGAEAFEGLLKALKEAMPEVRDVRLTDRLTESACCLAGDPGTVPPHIARIMERMGQAPDPEAAKRVLELNPDHPAVVALRDLHQRSPQEERVGEYGKVLYDLALIAEGSKVKDPSALAARIGALLVRDAGK